MRIKSWVKNKVTTASRFLLAFKRPTKQTNLNKLQQAGLSVDTFTIRQATPEDITALSELHSIAWRQTYPTVKNPPTAKLREQQWRQQFAIDDKNWFCLIVQSSSGQLIGFAKGKTYAHPSLPQFNGELNKIYLLSDYQRLGLGRRLLCRVALQFLDLNINNMVLFGEASNPSGYFHEAMGAKKQYAPNGEFHGAYGWYNLTQLVLVANL
ncbi:MAG: family N-acetyltransferase [Mucilaginibacter sp.]|nr:family N-acetyltransferase [Mucilaginibacter sp.]